MKRFHLKLMLTVMLAFNIHSASASHIIGGEIYWDCITEGEHAGKLRFYLKLYRDCSQNTSVFPLQTLQIEGHPIYSSFELELLSQTDVTPQGCGLSCATANSVSLGLEELIFVSDPVQLTGVPPQQGYQLSYNQCCRVECSNLQNADIYTLLLEATMYPINGQGFYPCFDSSPRSVQPPINVLCSGQELRYNASAVDPDADSLYFAFTSAVHENGLVPNAPDYSASIPLPGPTIDPSYDLVTLDPATGQMEYDLPPGLQGRWNTVTAVEAWRCGQLVSRNVLDMVMTVIPCSGPNNIPQITGPTWVSPQAGEGYAVTVMAGEVVNFTIEGADLDMNGVDPQLIEFVASGPQFGAYFTDADSGCANPPCATLSGIVPPIQAQGPLSTTFNWQTDCSHVKHDDVCIPNSSTYNFQFRYRDNFCPGQGTNFVNVAVTVLAEPMMESPGPRCVSIAEDSSVTLTWEPVAESQILATFTEHVILHSTSANGTFVEVGALNVADTGAFVHAMDNAVASPSVSGANFYQIRTRSGCNGEVLALETATVSTIHLSVQSLGSVANLSWTAAAQPALPTSASVYDVYRKILNGEWILIASAPGLSYTDNTMIDGGLVHYRVELSDELPCTSVSNIVEGSFNIGVRDGATGPNVTVSPNPSKGSFLVSIGAQTTVTGWEMIDLSGKVMRSDRGLAVTDRLTLETGLLPGAYLLRLVTDDGVAVRRIVIL